MKPVVVLIGWLAALTACTQQPPALPALTIEPSSFTVSGVSSGAYMAQQLHIAYSDQIAGAAILAGGPYGCAQGSLETALAQCVNVVSVDLSPLLARLKTAQQQRRIASLENLTDDAVWIFHGRRDSAISREVTEAAVLLYRALGVKPVADYTVDAEHGFPTENSGVPCNEMQEPYINNCDFDAAGALLKHLYPGLNDKDRQRAGRLIAFDQNQSLQPDQQNTLAKTGYVFVPERCEQGVKCRLHIALHGCQQNAETIGEAFVSTAGYNAWAAANDLVILYPQTRASLMPLNPKACWDWWGYTGENYLYRDGEQMRHILQMALQLSGADDKPPAK